MIYIKCPAADDSEETSEHQSTCKGLQGFTLSGYRQSSSGCFWVRLSAVETSNVSGCQMTQPYWKASDELFAYEGRFQTLNRFLFFY